MQLLQAIASAVASVCIVKSTASTTILLDAVRTTLSGLLGRLSRFCHLNLKVFTEMVAQMIETLYQLYVESLALKKAKKFLDLDLEIFQSVTSFVIDVMKSLLELQKEIGDGMKVISYRFATSPCSALNCCLHVCCAHWSSCIMYPQLMR